MNRTCERIRTFWSRVKKTRSCWLWLGGITGRGYGIFYWKQRSLGAHRVAWMIVYGAIPSGMLVCHTCDNPRCVRPRHLFLGTETTNDADMRSKGRQPELKGEKNGNASLTRRRVLWIKRLAASGMPTRKIAKRTRVGESTVSRIRHKHRWAHL